MTESPAELSGDESLSFLSAKRLGTLVQIQQRMLRPIIWNEETEAILEAIVNAVGAAGAVLWRRNLRAPGMLLIRQGSWMAAESPGTIDLTGSPLKNNLLQGKKVKIAPTAAPEETASLGIREDRDGQLFPLISRDTLFGAFIIQVPRGGELPGGGGAEFLSVIAVSLAMALERSHYHRELKESQVQFRQAQKMEAIGHFAGGIAHDFNNLLTVMQGNAAMLRERVSSDPLSSKLNEEVIQAADRASRLTRQLLAFARKRKLELRLVDLNEVIRRVEPMLSRLLGETIHLQADLCAAPLVAKADAHLIEQALLNVAANARDAVPRDGLVTFRTRSCRFAAGQAGLPKGIKPRTYACIEVRDTGAGIPPEIRERIFEPFFTTKPVGQGSGFGLATVYAILQQHEGWVEAESESGEGTSIRLFFPLTGEKEAPPPPSAPAAPAAPVPPVKDATAETILLVEDQQAVLKLAQIVLERAGYRVLTAMSGPAAVSVWEKSKQDVSLLISDIVMPGGMSGIQLAERLCAERPELKVILVSGYSRDSNQVTTQAGRKVFLQKPYGVVQLTSAVSELLRADEPGGPGPPPG